MLSKITVILSAFTEGTVHSLTEITRHTGLPISTTHRHLTELAALRLLERTQDGRYQVGPSLRRIGANDARPPGIAERGLSREFTADAQTSSTPRLHPVLARDRQQRAMVAAVGTGMSGLLSGRGGGGRPWGGGVLLDP